MDIGAALPGRCVVCNQEAARRIPRTLYWSPAAWRYFSGVAPFVLLFGAIAGGVPILALLFWPGIIVIGIAHLFVRRKVKVDFAICDRHRRLRSLLQALSLAALAAMAVIFMNLSADAWSWLVVAVAALVVLAVVQAFVGVSAVSLKKLDREHAWLGGTGERFRAALPELPVS